MQYLYRYCYVLGVVGQRGLSPIMLLCPRLHACAGPGGLEAQEYSGQGPHNTLAQEVSNPGTQIYKPNLTFSLSILPTLMP